MKITIDADEIAEIVEAYVREKIAKPGSDISVDGPSYSEPTVRVRIIPPKAPHPALVET